MRGRRSKEAAEGFADFSRQHERRVELAGVGLEFLAEADRINTKEPSDKSKGESKAWIIATDSEYVVKGMTEWLPTWRVYIYPTIPNKGLLETLLTESVEEQLAHVQRYHTGKS